MIAQERLEAEAAAEAARKAEEERKAAEEARLEMRQGIVDFALQFVGNPYVYGGTSLTNGADCSGFVMSVFAEFGYELPRVAAPVIPWIQVISGGRDGLFIDPLSFQVFGQGI